jgi:Phosphopantetheine attachment site
MEPAAVRRRIEALVSRLYDGACGESAGATLPFCAGQELFDSVAALQLILELEKEFKILVEDGDIVPENLESLESLADFVCRKIAAGD